MRRAHARGARRRRHAGVGSILLARRCGQRPGRAAAPGRRSARRSTTTRSSSARRLDGPGLVTVVEDAGELARAVAQAPTSIAAGQGDATGRPRRRAAGDPRAAHRARPRRRALMRRLLTLAYHFPPVGGGGVQRNRRFAEHLPDLGWTPVVVTGTGGQAARWTPLGPHARRRRAGPRRGAPRPGPRARARHRRRAPGRRPARAARRAAAVVARRGGRGRPRGRRDCDAIFASLIPYQTTEAAIALSRELGIPWIADLQDPWALDEMWLYPTGLHHRVDRRRMRRQLASAAAIVMNTPEAARRLVDAFPELATRIVVSITNGFDAADFAGPAPARADDSAFRIVHTRHDAHEHGPAAPPAPPAAPLLVRGHARRRLPAPLPRRAPRGVRRLGETDPDLVAGVEVHLAGVLTEDDRRVGEASPHARLLGYRSHEQTLALDPDRRPALPAHARPAAGPPGRARPGQGLRVRRVGRPILAAVPDGDVREILGDAGTARFCRPADVGTMAAILRDELLRHRAGSRTAPWTGTPSRPTSAARSRRAWPRSSTTSRAPDRRPRCATRPDAAAFSRTGSPNPGALHREAHRPVMGVERVRAQRRSGAAIPGAHPQRHEQGPPGPRKDRELRP